MPYSNPDELMIGSYANGYSNSPGMSVLDALLYAYDSDIAPDMTFAPFATKQDTGAGSVKGMGFPTATWHWSLINVSQREELRELCSGLSAHVYVRMPVRDTSSGVLVYHTFDAYMLWEVTEEGMEQNLSELDFKILFRYMIMVE
jgi:hypothetical protein